MRPTLNYATFKINLLVFSGVCLICSVEAANLSSWNILVDEAAPLHWYRCDEVSGLNCLDSGS